MRAVSDLQLWETSLLDSCLQLRETRKEQQCLRASTSGASESPEDLKQRVGVPPEVWFGLAVIVAIFRPSRWFSQADRVEYPWAKL